MFLLLGLVVMSAALPKRSLHEEEYDEILPGDDEAEYSYDNAAPASLNAKHIQNIQVRTAEKKKHVNSKYPPNISLNPSLKATLDKSILSESVRASI